MATERLVKWSKESKDFFKLSSHNSVVLDVFISYGCASQIGEGFEELVNHIYIDTQSLNLSNIVIPMSLQSGI